MKLLSLLLIFLLHPSAQAQGDAQRTRNFFSQLRLLGAPPQIGECSQSRGVQSEQWRAPEHYKQVKLNCHSSRQASYQGLTLSILTQEQAQNLFNELSSLDYLPMKYLEDGCYARAHEITLIAERNGLQMGKAFLNSPENDEILYPESLRNQNPARLDHQFSGWRYHATPFLLVEQPDGTLAPTVFDLGVASGPQNFEQWRANLHPRPRATTLTTRHKDFVFESGDYTSRNVSIIDRLQETQDLIDDLGWSEYIFRLEQGWL